LIVVVVVALLLSNGFWAVSSQGSKNTTVSDGELSARISTLTEQQTTLRAQYAEICDEHNDTVLELTAEKDNYTELYDDYIALKGGNAVPDTNSSYYLAKITSLNRQLVLAEQNYSLAKQQYDSLNVRYSQMNANYTKLLNERSTDQERYDSLNATYNQIVYEYNSLLMDRSELDYLKMVRLTSLALDYYDTLRAEKGTYNTDQGEVTFYSQLSRHDRGAINWPALDNTYKEHAGSLRYVEARNTLVNIDLISGAKNASDTMDKMNNILNFVNWKVSYSHDMDDTPFAPTETLSSGTGDCEDFAILVSALFELEGIQSAIATFDNVGGGPGHAMVLVHMDDLGLYDYYHYDDLTRYGLESGQWIIIEPRYMIYEQHIESWFSQWQIDAASET
jgi:predicted transglutaminase-like cysteine proteinase